MDNLKPQINYYEHHLTVMFNRSCLEQSKIDYSNEKKKKFLHCLWTSLNSNINDPTLQNCLFGLVTLTKNVDIDKYKYSGYGIGFDRKGVFSFPSGGFGQNVVIFGADMSSSPHIDNKGKDNNIRKKTNARIRWKFINLRKMYSINFTVPQKKFFLSLHYNGLNSYLFVNGKEIIKFKAKDSFVAGSLCLGNISKGWPSSNMKKTGLNGYVYEFNVDYSNNNTKDAISYIHNYLMSKYDIG